MADTASKWLTVRHGWSTTPWWSWCDTFNHWLYALQGPKACTWRCYLLFKVRLFGCTDTVITREHQIHDGTGVLCRVRAYFKKSTTVLENVYLRPFQFSLWLVAGIALGTIALVHFASVNVLRRLSPNSSAADDKFNDDWNLTWIIAVISQQGNN